MLAKVRPVAGSRRRERSILGARRIRILKTIIAEVLEPTIDTTAASVQKNRLKSISKLIIMIFIQQTYTSAILATDNVTRRLAIQSLIQFYHFKEQNKKGLVKMY